MTVLLSPVGGVAAQFFDNNGNPLSGGKLYSYSAGTTTPAATYTSSLGVTAHTNPIVLDAGGRVPGGEIWLTDGVIYKFVLQTSTNVLIATYDNIVGINSNFVNYTTEQEIQTATAGQTVFNLTTTQYQPGTNSLSVFVDGVNQYGPGAQYAYLETDSDTVTFVSGLHVGASVKFTTATQTTGNATDASVVAYTPPFTGSVTTNVEDKLAQYVSVMDFGADPTGTVDSTAALQAARDYLAGLAASNIAMPALIFPGGTYLYSVSPNWAISSVVVLPEGEVKLRYTGVGTAVVIDAGISGFAYNVTFGSLDNYFKIEAPSTAQNGIFCRSVHHSNVFVNVRGCGATWAAMRIEFAVCTVFGLIASQNEAPWYLGAVPKRGIEATRRAVNDTCSACTFINPIVEAVSETGIWFDHAIKNLILNGTSEGNPAGWGVVCTANSQYNNFDGIDLEVNALGGIEESGRGNSYINVLDSDLTSITSTALNTKFINGTYNAITNDGNGTEFNGIEYGNDGGAFTDTGQFTTRKSVYFITGNRYLPDLTPLSLESTVSCPNNTATTVLTLPLTGSNFYQIVAQIPSAGAASLYGAYAVIYQDTNTSRIVTQNNAPNMVLTLVSQEVKITQTSGVTANVYARAVAI
jgi:hypothetical protein